MSKIPFLDLRPALSEIADASDAAIRRVIERGVFLGGEEVAAFEEEWAAYCNVDCCVACASGTDALSISAKSLGLSQSLIQANTTQYTSIGLRRGSIFGCLFSDVGELGTPSGPVTVPVLLYGRWRHYRELSSLLVDACQAHGWKVENKVTAPMAAWSFYPTKNLGAFGDAGAITCSHSMEKRVREIATNWHSRMSEIDAAVLRVKLPHLDRWNTERKVIAATYWDELPKSVRTVHQPSEVMVSNHHIFAILAERRNELKQYLAERGIETKIHYEKPLLDLPGAVEWSKSVLSLPCYPGMPRESVVDVCDAIRSFYK